MRENRPGAKQTDHRAVSGASLTQPISAANQIRINPSRLCRLLLILIIQHNVMENILPLPPHLIDTMLDDCRQFVSVSRIPSAAGWYGAGVK